MAEVVKTRFKQLSKTSTEWTSLNPTLLEGEIGFEKDTKKIKVGDGIIAWNNLDYITGNGGESSGGGGGGTVIAKTYSNWDDLVADFDSLVSTGKYRVINIQIIDFSLTENNFNMEGTAINLLSHEIQTINKDFSFLGGYAGHSYSGSLPQNGIMYLYGSYNLTPSSESSIYLCTDVVALNYADSSDPFVPLRSIQIYRTASYIDYNSNNIEHLYGVNRYNFSDFTSITIDVLYAEINL